MFEAHFQTFEEPEGGVALTARLAAFREELARRKLTGFVIPRADQQQNEYVAPSEERLAWLTGFTGSAGMAVVLVKEAAVFVDGRYTLQAAKQVDGKAWSVEPLVDPPPESWLEKHLIAGDRLGFDPWLHTSAAAERLAAACAKAGAELIAVDSNPWDLVGTDRPPPPLAPVTVHGRQFSGEAETDKLGRIRTEIIRLGVDALVLSDSHAVAWTFKNPRGAVLCAGAEGRPPHGVHRPPQVIEQRTRSSRTVGRCRGAGRTGTKTHRACTARRIDCARQRDCCRRPEPPDRGRGRQAGARQRPGKFAQSRQELDRDRRHQERASARCGGARAISRLDRPRSRIGRADGDRHRRGVGDIPPRHRRIEGRLVSDHRRNRAERRYRALPRHPQDQPADFARRPAADRFRRAI